MLLILLLAACQTQEGTTTQEVNPTVESTANASAGSSAESSPTRQFAGSVPAPEFPVGADWLNVDHPLTLADLHGKIVLLDFWTYGCINCMHVIPDLKALEEKYAEELVVIGVHSAKFENEGETDNIRRIIQRYDLQHPVINDRDFRVWREYGAQAWPTFVLIDPLGNVVGFQSGEGIYDLFDQVIGTMVQEFASELDRTPLELVLERDSLANLSLLFPGKVLADPAGERLFIADTNHDRIVVADPDGYVLDVIGSGLAGFSDGTFETAQFFRPQGLTLADEQTLYVADTGNHSIRRINLATGEVETAAGIGRQIYMQITSGPALSTGLNSPWDLLYHDGLVYIAMAGQHQIWIYDPAAEELRLFAGSGREELRDGPLAQAGLNQPSGLATDGELLYIADSEASAIRAAQLEPDGELSTIVGTGLFDFGDVDGEEDDVRLQHPLGVVYSDGQLLVADTYNSKIKLIDPEQARSETLLGGPESGWRDGTEPLFDEPGGLTLLSHRLYIADTNNHVIRVADLSTGEVSTLVLIDGEGLLTRTPVGEEFVGEVITFPPQTVGVGEGTIELSVQLPVGYKVNDLAPFSMRWTDEQGFVTRDGESGIQHIAGPQFPLSLPASFAAGETTLTSDLVIYYCDAQAQSLCLIEQVRLRVPLTVVAGAEPVLLINHEVELPGEVRQ
jgi:thiol-disulfide isomerase/thioredoxin/sugar lactone lactonase YvrE